MTVCSGYDIGMGEGLFILLDKYGFLFYGTICRRSEEEQRPEYR